MTFDDVFARSSRRWKTGRNRSIVGMFVISLLFWSGPSSEGSDVADLIVTEGQPAENDYGAIVLSSPDANPPGRAPANCAGAASYCDVADLTINVPSSYNRFNLYSVVVTLSWSSPSTNNMNLYLYDTNRTTNLRSSATANHPERVEVLEPSSGRYALTILNESGANTGYKLKAEFVSKGTIPETAEPKEEFGSPSQGEGSSSEFGFEDPILNLPSVPLERAQKDQIRAVETPGPDGPTTKATLATLGVAKGFENPTQLASMVLGVVGTLVALGFGAVLFVRHRRGAYYEGSSRP